MSKPTHFYADTLSNRLYKEYKPRVIPQTTISKEVPENNSSLEPASQNQNEQSIQYSIVIPLYNEAESLGELTEKIHQVLAEESFEIIFVDDGSCDESWPLVRELANNYPSSVKGIKHRRNFGKADALASGFANAKGKIIVTLDADLQDDPEEILKLSAKLDEGYDVVTGWKKHGTTLYRKHFPLLCSTLRPAVYRV